MATAGPNFPGTSANRTGTGTVAWANPSNANADDGSRTTATATPISDRQTNYLYCSNFSFSIPSGSTINGITVTIEKQLETTTTATDTIVSIVKADNSIGSTNYKKAGNWPTPLTVFTYGGVSDLWGETWSYSDINDVDFGIVISGRVAGGFKSSGYLHIDYVKISIDYTTGSSFIASKPVIVRQAITRASNF